MSTKNDIILSTPERGVREEGTIIGTPLPGTVMQLQSGTAKVNGRFSWEVYNVTADGDKATIAVLLPNKLEGKLITDAYVTGTRGFLYFPAMGEILNMLVADVSGTGDDHTIGEVFMVDDSTGKLIATTGSVESEPFVCLEATTDPTADAHLECRFSGY